MRPHGAHRGGRVPEQDERYLAPNWSVLHPSMAQRRLSIAYVLTRGDDLGGVQVHVRDMAAAMREQDHDVTIICGTKGVFTDQLTQRGLHYHLVPHLIRPIRPFHDALALKELRAVLRELRPDLISLHGAKPRMLGCIAARSVGVPSLMTAHGWSFADGQALWNRLCFALGERCAARMARSIVTVSQYDRELALRYGIGMPERVTVVHNGMSDNAPIRDHARAAGPVRLFMVGRHAPQKDHPTLFRALAELRHLPWVLDLVGVGPYLERNIAAAGELGMADRIRFLGYREDVADLMAHADVYILASRWEGLPRSIIEAMRAGLPTISSDVGGCRELVIAGSTGYLVGRGDNAAMANRLGDLIRNAEQRKIMGHNARRRFEEAFTFDAMFRRTLSVYYSVLAGTSSAEHPLNIALS